MLFGPVRTQYITARVNAWSEGLWSLHRVGVREKEGVREEGRGEKNGRGQ